MLRETVRETNSFKRLVESEKLAESEKGETINGWNEGIDNKLADIDGGNETRMLDLGKEACGRVCSARGAV